MLRSSLLLPHVFCATARARPRRVHRCDGHAQSCPSISDWQSSWRGRACALPLAGRLIAPADSDAVRYAWFSVPLRCRAVAGISDAMVLLIAYRLSQSTRCRRYGDVRRTTILIVTLLAALGCLTHVAIGSGPTNFARCLRRGRPVRSRRPIIYSFGREWSLKPSPADLV